MRKALTTSEARDLVRLEKVIDRGVKTFVAVGSALAEINERKLYRERAETFDDYCKQVWGFSRQRAYQYIEAAKVEASVAECQPAVVIPTERHARELGRLPEEDRAGCVAAAREKYGEKLTAAQLGEEVESRLGTSDEAQIDDDLTEAEDEEADQDSDDIDDDPAPASPTLRPLFVVAVSRSIASIRRDYPNTSDEMAAAVLHSIAATIQAGDFDWECWQ